MAFAADGRAFVCTTISGGLTVLSPEGEVLEEIMLGECATNCIFDGPTLYVTATKVADLGFGQTTGTFWSVETDATGGLPLIPGQAVAQTATRSPLAIACSQASSVARVASASAGVQGTAAGSPRARRPGSG